MKFYIDTNSPLGGNERYHVTGSYPTRTAQFFQSNSRDNWRKLVPVLCTSHISFLLQILQSFKRHPWRSITRQMEKGCVQLSVSRSSGHQILSKRTREILICTFDANEFMFLVKIATKLTGIMEIMINGFDPESLKTRSNLKRLQKEESIKDLTGETIQNVNRFDEDDSKHLWHIIEIEYSTIYMCAWL